MTRQRELPDDILRWVHNSNFLFDGGIRYVDFKRAYILDYDLVIDAYRFSECDSWHYATYFRTRPSGMVEGVPGHGDTYVGSWASALPKIRQCAVGHLRVWAEINRRNTELARLLQECADSIDATPPRFSTMWDPETNRRNEPYFAARRQRSQSSGT